MDKKRVLGQFFTKDELWLKPQVLEFIKESNSAVAYNPFAGARDLLKAAQERCGFSEVVGLDIDDKLTWEHNDSLLNIPHLDNAIIITNPPYISNYSAARKGLTSELAKYFASSKYNDVYLIALDKMVQAQKNVVAIIPETFINSNYDQKISYLALLSSKKTPLMTPRIQLSWLALMVILRVYRKSKYIKMTLTLIAWVILKNYA